MRSGACSGFDRPLDQTPRHFVTLKSRARVQAESVQAVRLGVDSQREAGNFATAMQLESIEMAGLRAAGVVMAAR